MLYAVSDYCRTVFQGSFPAKCTNGIITINLDPFSFNTVQIFVNLIYGEKVCETSDVDAVELFRLADYLQVHQVYSQSSLER